MSSYLLKVGHHRWQVPLHQRVVARPLEGEEERGGLWLIWIVEQAPPSAAQEGGANGGTASERKAACLNCGKTSHWAKDC